MWFGRFHRYRVMTEPLKRPRNLPSSRANIPLGISASLVTHTVFVLECCLITMQI